MMMGTVPTSVPQIILMANWLLEGNFKVKWDRVCGNTLFWILSSVFLIHVLGLLYTGNLGAGIDDVRTKLPLMFLPLLFLSSGSLSRKEVHLILVCFLIGSVVNTLWCLAYSFVLHTTEVVRNTSRFMSHIRLGLYLNIAIAVCVYFIIQTSNLLRLILLMCLALYFVSVLFILGLASGLVNFGILFLLSLNVFIYRQKPLYKLLGLLTIVAFVALVSNYLLNVKDAQLTVKESANNKVMTHSPSGRLYIHFDSTGHKENGNYVFINVQLQELQKEWNKQFPQDSFCYSPPHNLQRYEVLVRYLASKGLNKDSAGFAALSVTDKENIRRGVSNFEYPGWSFLRKRTYELVTEYDEFVNNRYVNGHSLTMRLYFWKAAVHIIKNNVVFGVGTGDVQAELNKTYVETKSPLKEEWYKRPHNQFLTIMVALGGIGVLVFLVSLIYPLIKFRKNLHVLYLPFFIIAVISFLVEDTLETQAGLTFFAFFNSLFLSMAWHEKQKITL